MVGVVVVMVVEIVVVIAALVVVLADVIVLVVAAAAVHTDPEEPVNMLSFIAFEFIQEALQSICLKDCA